MLEYLGELVDVQNFQKDLIKFYYKICDSSNCDNCPYYDSACILESAIRASIAMESRLKRCLYGGESV